MGSKGKVIVGDGESGGECGVYVTSKGRLGNKETGESHDDERLSASEISGGKKYSAGSSLVMISTGLSHSLSSEKNNFELRSPRS